MTNSNTWHIVETLFPGPTTKPEEVHKQFNNARVVHVVMEVYEKKGEDSMA